MTERLLLDTHAWIWLFGSASDRITPSIQKRIEAAAARAELCVSTISVWELGLLDIKGRITLGRPVEEWVAEALSKPGIRVVNLEPGIALAATRLPGAFHADPVDRILVATARHLDAGLVTADAAIHTFAAEGHLRVVKL